MVLKVKSRQLKANKMCKIYYYFSSNDTINVKKVWVM
jgi:hypothetical protein